MRIRHARLADVEALGELLDDYRVFYGQALALALALAEGVRHLKLSTGIDNRIAQSLYETQGWQRDRAFHHYALSLDQRSPHVPSP